MQSMVARTTVIRTGDTRRAGWSVQPAIRSSNQTKRMWKITNLDLYVQCSCHGCKSGPMRLLDMRLINLQVFACFHNNFTTTVIMFMYILQPYYKSITYIYLATLFTDLDPQYCNA